MDRINLAEVLSIHMQKFIFQVSVIPNKFRQERLNLHLEVTWSFNSQGWNKEPSKDGFR